MSRISPLRYTNYSVIMASFAGNKTPLITAQHEALESLAAVCGSMKGDNRAWAIAQTFTPTHTCMG